MYQSLSFHNQVITSIQCFYCNNKTSNRPESQFFPSNHYHDIEFKFERKY